MKTYAAFFEWHDKGRKELGIVEELIDALALGAGMRLHAPREFSPDPPDCIALDEAGRAVGIEVAEVVCETAARLSAQGMNVVRHWAPGELAAHVARELADKDGKRFHGGPYARVVACLFTDEPALAVAEAERELGRQTFGPFRQLTDAYLLFSYEPARRSYPVVRLRLRPRPE